MIDYFIYIGLFLLGAALGSFAGAQVWRIRSRQLQEDEANGEKINSKELVRLKPLLGSNIMKDRSQCLSCHHRLRWYDLLPIVSWVWLRGRCRYCREPIGWTEILLEIGLASIFVLSFWLWPGDLSNIVGVSQFVIWLISLVLLAILFVYDMRWFLLPDRINIPFIVLGFVFASLVAMGSSGLVDYLVSTAGAVAILSGLYLLLYFVSKGAWVGFGDVKLGLGMALFLGDWLLAFITLFAANLFGTILVLPGMLNGKVKRQSKIPFGPLLIAGFLFAWFVGDFIIEWYLKMIFV